MHGDYPRQVFLDGRGVGPVSPEALERAARETLQPHVYAYIAGGAGSGQTMRANRRAFSRWSLLPRLLGDIGEVDTSVRLFSEVLSSPIIVAPIGALSIITPEAEVGVARAAAAVGVTMCMSTSASKSIEEVGQALGPARGWFQLYWPSDPDLGTSFVRRAEAAGFSAIVLTLDNRVQPFRPLSMEYGYVPFLAGEAHGVYTSDPIFRARLSVSPEVDVRPTLEEWQRVCEAQTLTWETICEIRTLTSLPLIVKGVLRADDARRVVDLGADAVVVSNHGGRQVDSSVASLTQLPEVVAAVAGDIPVLFDSGIRTGANVLTAVALGAAAVMVGRPLVWALATRGEAGVQDALRCLLADVELTMANLGVSHLCELREVISPCVEY